VIGIYLYPALFALGLAAGWYGHSLVSDAEIAQLHSAASEAREKSIMDARKIEALLDDAVVTAAALDAERKRKAKIVETVITEEVIKYVQTPGSRNCAVDSAGVRIIDAAAAGRVPENPAAATRSDAGATGAQVVETVAANYGTCHSIANQLRALQAWALAIQ